MNGPVRPDQDPWASGPGAPVASPVGHPSAPALSAVRGDSGPVLVPNDPAGSAPIRFTGRRVGPRRLQRLQVELSDRDWLVLRSVDRHRFLTTAQIEGFTFHGHASTATAARTCRRVLRRLERDGLLRSLPRRQGGPTGGSTPATWQLAPGGARLLDNHGPNYRISLPTTRYLAHCLAVADAHLAVLDHARRADLAAQVTVEQQAWRHYTGLGGERLWLKPDLFAALTGRDAHGAYEDRWFIEVDLGTESLPTLLRKCEQYETYRRSGIEQSKINTFPLVLWLFEDPARGVALRHAVGRKARLTPALYRYAELATVASVLAGVPA